MSGFIASIFGSLYPSNAAIVYALRMEELARDEIARNKIKGKRFKCALWEWTA